MPEILEAPPQAIAAETPTTDQSNLTDGRTISEISEELTLARITHAPASDIQRLEAQMEQRREASQQQAEQSATKDDPNAVYWGEEAPVIPIEAPKAEEETKPTEPAGDTPQAEDETKVSDRLRISHLNDSDKALQNAVTLMTRGGMTLQEAYRRVFGEPEAQAAPTIPEVEPTEVSALEAQATELETKLAEIEAQLDENNDALQNSELTKQHGRAVLALAKLAGRLETAKLAELGNAEKRVSLGEAKQKVLEQVVQDWPDLGDQNSAHWLVAHAIALEIQSNPAHPEHARAKRADFVSYCADVAATKLGKTQTKAETKPAAPAATQTAAATVRPPGPASGSRSTAPPSPQKTVQQAREESAAALQAQLTGHAGAYTRRTGTGGVVILR